MMPLVLLALSIVPVDVVVRDRVDIAEVNSYYDGDGKLVFVQLVFWDYKPTGNEVVAWRMMRDVPDMQPRRLPNGEYQSLWFDTKDNVLRDVRAATYEASHTQVDVELAHREILPQERRRGLARR